MNLTLKILFAMIAGALLGLLYFSAVNFQLLPDVFLQLFSDYVIDGVVYVVGKAFVSLLKMLVVPLVFVSLVCGCASLTEKTSIGRLAGKTIALYLLTTALAITLALCVGTLIQPGGNVSLSVGVAGFSPPQATMELRDVFVNMIPSNPIAAMGQGAMIQVIVFAIIVGMSMSALPVTQRAGVVEMMESWNAVCMQMVSLVMKLSPYGVFALMVPIFANFGVSVFASLLGYMGAVLLTLLLHAVLVYGLLVKALARLPFGQLLKKIRNVVLFAFSTSSSNATLPVTMEAVQKRLGVHGKVASFTVPLGATINMDGTAIMQGVAATFIAQVYGIELGFQGYTMIMLTATLASIGSAGVPGVGLVTLALVLEQVGLPVEGIALILGVDRILDMARTALNVTGDSVVSVLVAKSEGALDEERYRNASYAHT